MYRRIVPFLLATLCVVALNAQGRLTLVQLDQGGWTFFFPNDVNNKGQVVGTAVTVLHRSYGFMIESNVFKGLCPAIGAQYCTAVAINDGGQIIGTFTAGDGTEHGYVLAGKSVVDLGAGRMPAAISDTGEVVGSYYTGGVHRVWLWRNGSFSELATWSSQNVVGVVPKAINARGEVVVQVSPTYGVTGLVLIKQGTTTPLQIPGQFVSVAGINDSGEIAGYFLAPDTYASSVFIWRNGDVQILHGFTPGDAVIAGGFSNRSDIVGQAGGRAALWRDGGVIDLNTLIPPDSGCRLAIGLRITESGYILAGGLDSRQIVRYYLLK